MGCISLLKKGGFARKRRAENDANIWRIKALFPRIKLVVVGRKARATGVKQAVIELKTVPSS